MVGTWEKEQVDGIWEREQVDGIWEREQVDGIWEKEQEDKIDGEKYGDLIKEDGGKNYGYQRRWTEDRIERKDFHVKRIK